MIIDYCENYDDCGHIQAMKKGFSNLSRKNDELRALCEKMYQVLVDVEMYCDIEILTDKADSMLNEVDQWRKDNE